MVLRAGEASCQPSLIPRPISDMEKWPENEATCQLCVLTSEGLIRGGCGQYTSLNGATSLWVTEGVWIEEVTVPLSLPPQVHGIVWRSVAPTTCGTVSVEEISGPFPPQTVTRCTHHIERSLHMTYCHLPSQKAPDLTITSGRIVSPHCPHTNSPSPEASPVI